MAESEKTELNEKEVVSKNFIEQIIDKDLAEGVYDSVCTRFPPEPNGYLHIGHAKSILLNYGLAQKYNGKFHMRFDDTNPTKERAEFVDSIKADIKWLGADWEDRLYFASDYFGQMYEAAVKLIQKGKAYVSDLSAEEIREYRGTLTEPGREDPGSGRSVEENLKLFEEMKEGVHADGSKVLRARIDMASPNMNMRDPVIYRVAHMTHHNTGDKWCIYPMYDFAHPIEDAIEGITHSICTLEFEDHRPLYDWVVRELEYPHPPKQIEFAKLYLTNVEATVESFYARTSAVCAALPEIRVEYIFVDDGSRDGTLAALKELAARDGRVRWLALSRNFGKEAALFAGLEHARGDYVAVMDADLQDPPALLPELLRIVRGGGFDCAAVRRVDRKGEPPIRSWFARQFYRLINKMSRTEIVDGARDYRLMTRQMADAVLRVTEYNRFSKGIFSWVGFRTKWVETENVERAAGESKWSFFKLLVYALDGITAFSTVPLAMASVLGLVFCAVAFFAILFVIARQLIWGGSAFGWPSLVCIILFLAGIQLFCIGIVGQYLAKTYLEVKGRPVYLLRDSGGGDGHEGAD